MPDPIVIHAHGAAIPALGLGTFRSEGDVCVRAVSEAIRVGYRHIDTARMYGNETEVGEGIRASGVPRDRVFVTTKVWFEDIADGNLQRSAEASLKRLGLDAMDLLLIYWPNRSVPLESSIKGLCDAKRRGLARNIGVSNHPVALLDKAVALATEPLVAEPVRVSPDAGSVQSHRRLPSARHGVHVLYAAWERPRYGEPRRARHRAASTVAHPRRSCCAGMCNSPAWRRYRNRRIPAVSPRISRFGISASPTMR